MANPKHTSRKASPAKKSNKTPLIAAGILALLIIGYVLVKSLTGGGSNALDASAADLKITKSEITETAKFYPYKAGGTNMEVVAVKASDGSIRTAFNTCQVCFASGKGYYKQEGDELVCQNCGNRFQIDQVEKIKGGCNPVPILEEDKTDDGTNIIISKEFLANNRELFGNWRR